MTRSLALIAIAFAIGEDAGPASAPPAPATAPAPASTPAATAMATDEKPAAATPHVEGEGEEGDHAPTPPTPPAPTPPKGPGYVRLAAVIKDGMVRVPASKFTMGSSDKNAPPNERPARVIGVPTFWIDRTEVTVGAYRACVDAAKCERPARSSTTCTYDLGDALLPVSCVSWEMAKTFCTANGKRLPREVEWELAARGATPVRYPWGGQGTSCGTSVTLVHDGTQRSCGRKGPTRVATHLGGVSPFGALDMSGNVEEWVADWYGESTSDLSPRAGASHVLRGGGWLTIPSLAKTTSRNWGSVREAGPNVGFRCGRDE